ncbi:hypothetical protein CFP66_46400 [Pseudonocardia sp. MH-G8]|nr:hypothetical protein CFP66_46400 [Pseudonocardia sp. MH-G8]
MAAANGSAVPPTASSGVPIPGSRDHSAGSRAGAVHSAGHPGASRMPVTGSASRRTGRAGRGTRLPPCSDHHPARQASRAAPPHSRTVSPRPRAGTAASTPATAPGRARAVRTAQWAP